MTSPEIIDTIQQLLDENIIHDETKFLADFKKLLNSHLHTIESEEFIMVPFELLKHVKNTTVNDLKLILSIIQMYHKNSQYAEMFTFKKKWLFENQLITQDDKRVRGFDNKIIGIINGFKFHNNTQIFKAHDAAEYVCIELTKHLVNIITNMGTKQYCRATFQEIKVFSKLSGLKLFLLLKTQSYRKEYNVLLSRLLPFLGLNDNHISHYIKQTIIPTIKQINSETSLKVELTPIKNGRQISSLCFTYKGV